MKLPETGLDRDTIRDHLDAFEKGDLDWEAGRIMGYVYSPGEAALDVAKQAYMRFLIPNPLDPSVFPSLLRMENDVVGIALDHLSAPESSAGNFTSGGTESIMLASLAARNHGRAVRGIERPQMVMPVTAHAAFHKACEYLGIEKVLIDVDPETFRARAADYEAAITDRTVLLVASAPSYAHGVADPIDAIGKVAEAHGVLLHVDACVGGWILPFFERLGVDTPPFDFRVPGVTSISMDFHKYGYVPKGASVVLYRDKKVREHSIFACSTWTGYTVINPTVQSSRTGGPLASCWAVLHYLGDAGYLDMAKRMHDASEKLLTHLRAHDDLELMTEPDFCMFAFTSPTLNIFQLADEMRTHDWYIQPQLHCRAHPANIHLSVSVAVAEQMDDFIEKLDIAVEAVKAAPTAEPPQAVADQIAQMVQSNLSDEMFQQLLAGMGVDGYSIPEETATINALMDKLPEDVSQELLTRFFNELLRAS